MYNMLQQKTLELLICVTTCAENLSYMSWTFINISKKQSRVVHVLSKNLDEKICMVPARTHGAPSFHMQVWAGWRKTVGGSARITIECTCKLPVTVASVTELGDQLAVDLKDEDAAGLVVDHDDVAVPVHRHALRAHQLPWANLVLQRETRTLNLMLMFSSVHIWTAAGHYLLACPKNILKGCN